MPSLPKTLIVLNPISGRISLSQKLKMINSLFKDSDFEIVQLEKNTYATFLKKKILNENFQLVVAAGGDGTANLVAKAILDSNIEMGILPFGSGNGLARHLHIPLNIKKAYQALFNNKKIEIDCGWINGEIFLATAGIGFDALVSSLFARSSKRGLINYIRIILCTIKKYRPESYRIYINGERFRKRYFLITFANVSQYGNNAVIAPHASVTDGILDICMIRKVTWKQLPIMFIKLMTGKLSPSKQYKHYRSNEVIVDRRFAGAVHFDGESKKMDHLIHVKILPQKICIRGGAEKISKVENAER